jgi:hypothetical protein
VGVVHELALSGGLGRPPKEGQEGSTRAPTNSASKGRVAESGAVRANQHAGGPAWRFGRPQTRALSAPALLEACPKKPSTPYSVTLICRAGGWGKERGAPDTPCSTESSRGRLAPWGSWRPSVRAAAALANTEVINSARRQLGQLLPVSFPDRILLLPSSCSCSIQQQSCSGHSDTHLCLGAVAVVGPDCDPSSALWRQQATLTGRLFHACHRPHPLPRFASIPIPAAGALTAPTHHNTQQNRQVAGLAG